MNKEIISDKQGISMITLFIMGTTLVIGTAIEAKKDAWIAIILSAVIFLLISLMYSRILSLFPGKDLLDILEIVFGKFLGKTIGSLFVLYVFHLSTLVLRNLGEFIDSVALPETPMLLSMMLITFLCSWVVKEGVETLARLSEIYILFLIVIISFLALLIIPKMNFNNIRPIMGEGLSPALKGAFSSFAFPFGETVVFLMIFSSLKWKKSPYKTYIWGIIIGGAIIFVTSLINILVLGADIINLLYFPSYTAVTRINVANFLQRLEIGVSILFVVSVFIKLSVCLLSVTKGVAKLFNFNDYRAFITPIAILILNVSYILFESTMEMIDHFKIYPYYALIFQVILPLIIFIGSEFKGRKLTNKS